MNAWCRIGLTVAVLALASSGSAHAQRTTAFGRVTTTGKAPALSSRTTAPPGTARASLAASRARPTTSVKALAAYNAQGQGQAPRPSGSVSQIPKGSTARQEPEQSPAVSASAAPSRPHNYFPTMRPGRTVQQPVTLSTARKGGTGMAGGGGMSMGGAAGGGPR
jgi:hypothetical protein